MIVEGCDAEEEATVNAPGVVTGSYLGWGTGFVRRDGYQDCFPTNPNQSQTNGLFPIDSSAMVPPETQSAGCCKK